MPDDEFDSIPDEFANIQGIDWAALLSQNVPTPGTSSSASNRIYAPPTALHDEHRGSPSPEPESRSSAYFSDDNNLDLAFLTELDRVERQIMLGGDLFSDASPCTVRAHTLVTDGGAESASTIRLPDVEDIRTSRHVQRTGVIESNRGCGPSANVPLDLSCPHHPANQISSSGSGKAKANEIQDILSAYEDDLTCPICRDLLVAAHIGNPCGHTFCGECGWHWHIEKNKGCPCCRQALDKSVPMIPNIAIDNTVEKHINALAISGAMEWESEGRRYMEWISRMKSWRRGAQKRERRKRPKTLIPIETFDPPDDWLELELQDSDIELIPRPIRRARRRQQVFIQPAFELG